MPSSLNKGAGRRQRATTRQTGKPTVRRSPCGYRRTVFMPRLDARGPTVAAKGRATTTEAPVRGNRTGAKGAPQCGIDHTYTYIYYCGGWADGRATPPGCTTNGNGEHPPRSATPARAHRNCRTDPPPPAAAMPPHQRMSHKATQHHGPTGAATPRPAHAANSRCPGPSMQVKALAVGLSPVYKRLFHVLYQLHGV